MNRLLNFEYKVVDIDISEMFPNFPLHKVSQVYLGVDLSPFKERMCKKFSDLENLSTESQLRGHWKRLWFGGN